MESAERILSGKSHSSLWWGRLITLRLKAIAIHPNTKGLTETGIQNTRSLSFRRKMRHRQYLEDFLLKGYLVSPGDQHRRLRIIREFLEAKRALGWISHTSKTTTHDSMNLPERPDPDYAAWLVHIFEKSKPGLEGTGLKEADFERIQCSHFAICTTLEIFWAVTKVLEGSQTDLPDLIRFATNPFSQNPKNPAT